MGFKIQLDDKALERLLGGNTEAELELRNWVVQEFTKKYLKPLVKDAAFEKFILEEKRAVEHYTNKKIEEHIGKRTGTYPVTYALNSDLIKEIDKQVANFVQKYIDQINISLKNCAENIINLNEDKINKAIDARIEKIINFEVDKRVNEKLDKLRKAL